ncbi:MAG: lipid-A-disaccharide synthase N-terminal domain-containing protein [Chlamydiae bacterium]|nr:lipid-A-disaccharide synthase N-terminal domain-containing protein [Chlamydiota bacterium]
MDFRADLYPIGFIASFLFSFRFILQWIESESKGYSIVNPSFWYLSIGGNIALCLHAFIQIQYPLCLLQSLNAILAWRNLNLRSEKKTSFSKVIFILIITAFLITLAYIIQSYLSLGYIDWIRTPRTPWQKNAAQPLSIWWHILGFIGLSIFALRFWIQWWDAEKNNAIIPNERFWQTSLIGSCIALFYFVHMYDWVNIIGYGLGIIPYARNLILLQKKTK